MGSVRRVANPSAWGIASGYTDAAGTWRDATAETTSALLAAMGAEGDEPPAAPALRIVRAGQPLDLEGRWVLRTEDGGEEPVVHGFSGAPLGYHDLISEDDGSRERLIVSPGACHLPADLDVWGWSVQLYALRSASSWGMGDLGDLRRFAGWSKAHGAGLLLLNPLHAAAPTPQQEPSPYYPSSRSFRNPLYLRVEDVPGAAALGDQLNEVIAGGRSLNRDRRIDRDAVFSLKLSALGRLWELFPGDPTFDAFTRDGGDVLQSYAIHCTIVEQHGSDSRLWPDGLGHPRAGGVAAFADAHDGRVRFHMWLQWLVDRQLEAAGRDIDLMQDLAIGVDPNGADAWLWQDALVPSVSVGAQPDEYNTKGQDWGLPPFDPWKLRAACYEPFVQTVRAGFRHAGGLRFDHVMGLFRLFWIPQDGGGPAAGGYVQYPSSDLLDILSLESHRSGAYVVGEDLGTVEPDVRKELAARNVLSYRLAWFEPDPPSHFPKQSLGAVTTHDLPTVAGLWTGADLEAQRSRGMEPNVESTEELRSKLARWTRAAPDASVTEVTQRLYELLGESPSAIVTASLDDALGEVERPNYPGTTGGTNWSLALPAPLEDIEADPRVRSIADVLTGRSTG